MEWAIAAAGWIFAPICSALIVALVESRKRVKEGKSRDSDVEKARVIIEKASARAHVKHAYERYVINGEHMTIAAYEELLEEYEAYRLLGGNGTAKAYMEEIMKLKPYLVTD